ncbi:uncharacterized protein LOC100379037 [Saccoglossus kowalevskii]|uniref:Uncharacterized protein LOC100379037 n=1 Tax=Saccoglossus kowalevskii TaxID=10224 RepID=A0ABM0GYZ5_SACKO|nr:PREDICTED: uncharacterized protein LOC100379037 [Saccoglossus kowalevskii]
MAIEEIQTQYCDGRLLLYASATINMCIIWYFAAFICIDKLLPSILSERGTESLKLVHACYPEQTRRFYVDFLPQLGMPVVGLYLMYSSNVMEKPFSGPIDNATQVAFSVMLGIYLFRSFRELFTFGIEKHFKANLLHHVVTVVTYAVLLDSKENGVYGVIGLIAEGSSFFIELGKYLKSVSLRDHCFYKVVKSFGVVSTVSLRGLVPIVSVALSITTESPLTMGYISVTMFFTSGLFFGVINFYLVEAAVESALRQCFCDSRRPLGDDPRFRHLSTQIWQHRVRPDQYQSGSQAYVVAEPNIYDTLPPPAPSSPVKKTTDNIIEFSTSPDVATSTTLKDKQDSKQTLSAVSANPKYGSVDHNAANIYSIVCE